jgi:hypothetical protein
VEKGKEKRKKNITLLCKGLCFSRLYSIIISTNPSTPSSFLSLAKSIFPVF